MATWLLPTPGGASTSSTRGAPGSSHASATASASPRSSRTCSARGVAPGGKCARTSSIIGDVNHPGRSRVELPPDLLLVEARHLQLAKDQRDHLLGQVLRAVAGERDLDAV